NHGSFKEIQKELTERVQSLARKGEEAAKTAAESKRLLENLRSRGRNEEDLEENVAEAMNDEQIANDMRKNLQDARIALSCHEEKINDPRMCAKIVQYKKGEMDLVKKQIESGRLPPNTVLVLTPSETARQKTQTLARDLPTLDQVVATQAG